MNSSLSAPDAQAYVRRDVCQRPRLTALCGVLRSLHVERPDEYDTAEHVTVSVLPVSLPSFCGACWTTRNVSGKRHQTTAGATWRATGLVAAWPAAYEAVQLDAIAAHRRARDACPGCMQPGRSSGTDSDCSAGLCREISRPRCQQG
jgi:hypothetical protein